jgi:hypothetical protein
MAQCLGIVAFGRGPVPVAALFCAQFSGPKRSPFSMGNQPLKSSTRFAHEVISHRLTQYIPNSTGPIYISITTISLTASSGTTAVGLMTKDRKPSSQGRRTTSSTCDVLLPQSRMRCQSSDFRDVVQTRPAHESFVPAFVEGAACPERQDQIRDSGIWIRIRCGLITSSLPAIVL